MRIILYKYLLKQTIISRTIGSHYFLLNIVQSRLCSSYIMQASRIDRHASNDLISRRMYFASLIHRTLRRSSASHWNMGSRSLKMVWCRSLGTVSYSHSTVTMALPCIDSEIMRDVGRKSWFFIPPVFDAPIRGSLSEYVIMFVIMLSFVIMLYHVWYGKTRMVWLSECEQCLIMWLFNTIQACDRPIYCDSNGTVCAMHSITQ